MNTSPAERRADHLERRLHAAGKRFTAAARELAPLADELAVLEAEHRAALHQAGRLHNYRPPARELAADVVLGACACGARPGAATRRAGTPPESTPGLRRAPTRRAAPSCPLDIPPSYKSVRSCSRLALRSV